MTIFHQLPKMPLASLGAALLLALSGCTQDPPGPVIEAQTTEAPEIPNTSEMPFAAYTELTWEDNFDGTGLDSKKWVPEVKSAWYNNELQATTDKRANLTVSAGNLLITAVKENFNGTDGINRDYTSARIITKGRKNFYFGRLDIRAKLPKGKGLWPAIWMLGSNDTQVGWPACGEIDIMELKGSEPQTNISTIHFGTSVATKPPGQTQVYSLPAGDFADGFHTFTIIRSLNKIRWFVDGSLYFTRVSTDVTIYPFNNPFYLILNVAVGGDFDGNPDASTIFPQQMQVDYVRYYKYQE